MAGQQQFHLLSSLIIALALVPCAFGQTPQPGASQQSFTPGRRPALNGESANAPELENARRAIEALTPEQRKRFQENFLRWVNLSPEEKKLLREREEWRREMMTEEVERAIKQSGLNLDPARREAFVKRYTEERRAIEMQLRKDVEERRRPLVQALVAKLRQEFSSNPQATPTPATTATPAASQ